MKLLKKLLDWFQNSSLNRKIMILVFTVGVLPIGAAFMVSLSEMGTTSQEQLSYTVNQGFTQVFQAVDDRLERVQNISTLLAVNDLVSQNIIQAGRNQLVANQLACLDNISNYINGMEMVFEPHSILFYINAGIAVADDQVGRFRTLDSIAQTEWYARLKDNNGSATWIHYQEPLSGRSYIAVVREIWDPANYREAIGVLAVLFEREHLGKMLVASTEGQILYLETADGTLLASNVPEEELPRVPLGMRTIQSDRFTSRIVGGEEYLVRSQMMESTNIYLVSLVTESALEREVSAVTTRLQVIYIIISLLSLLAVIPLTRSITRRIVMLKEQMIRTQTGVISKLDAVEPGRDEIGQLISHYNDMVDKMGDLLQEQYALGQSKTEAELKALQSQINPHFLYNTLDMINWMAQKDETENIRNVVQAMSKFYRLTLSKGSNIVTIGDEIKMCDAYMEIQRRRYRGKILYEVEVDEEIERYLIPKITLQPFLENAIIHGINEKEDARGIVILNGWLEDGRITLSVTDDGTGMREEDKTKSHSGSHYGMENIAQRLELFFGEEIPIQVESSPGIGTCIVITIPAKTREEDTRK